MPRVTYSHISSFTLRTREEKANFIWSAICFKIMTLYTCGFLHRILAIIPATRYTCVVFLPRIPALFPVLRGFYSQVDDHFLTNAHIYAHQKAHIYALQTSMCIWVTESRRIRGTELYRQQKNPFMYDGAER